MYTSKRLEKHRLLVVVISRQWANGGGFYFLICILYGFKIFFNEYVYFFIVRKKYLNR